MLPLCSYHPSEPEFPPIQFKNSSLPVGEFPCCGETALRFQPIAQVRPTEETWHTGAPTLQSPGHGGLQEPGPQGEGAQPQGLGDVPHADDP